MNNHPYFLFLDDIRDPKDACIYPRRGEDGKILLGSTLENKSGIPNGSWKIVRSYDAFVACIEELGIPLAVSFDHDLADEHMLHYFNEASATGKIDYNKLTIKTGKHCAEYFLDKWRNSKHNGVKPKIFIHSANQWGAAEIQKALQELAPT